MFMSLIVFQNNKKKYTKGCMWRIYTDTHTHIYIHTHTYIYTHTYVFGITKDILVWQANVIQFSATIWHKYMKDVLSKKSLLF